MYLNLAERKWLGHEWENNWEFYQIDKNILITKVFLICDVCIGGKNGGIFAKHDEAHARKIGAIYQYDILKERRPLYAQGQLWGVCLIPAKRGPNQRILFPLKTPPYTLTS